MSPILGVIDSAKTGNLITGAWESLSTTIVTSNTATLDITGISTAYKDLRIHLRGRDNRSDAVFSTDNIAFNNSSARIQSQQMYGTGGSVNTVLTYSDQGQSGQLERWATSAGASNLVGGFLIDIKDYANTSKYKTWYYRSINAGSTTNQVTLHTLTWPSTAAINQLTFQMGFNVTAFTAPTTISIYGIRG